jgi:spore maturation protein B
VVYVIPILIILVLVLALKNGVPVYNTFISGVENGLRTVVSIIPPLIAILTVSAMLRASGLIDTLSNLLSPVLSVINFPAEILPLALIRPISGGGSIGLLTDTIKTFGVTSRITLCACILCASTETTFYTLSVYFGGTGVKYTKRVIFAAVFGDLVGILCATLLSTIDI